MSTRPASPALLSSPALTSELIVEPGTEADAAVVRDEHLHLRSDTPALSGLPPYTRTHIQTDCGIRHAGGDPEDRRAGAHPQESEAAAVGDAADECECLGLARCDGLRRRDRADSERKEQKRRNRRKLGERDALAVETGPLPEPPVVSIFWISSGQRFLVKQSRCCGARCHRVGTRSVSRRCP